MSIEISMIAGAIVGLLIALSFENDEYGRLALLAITLAMIAIVFVSQWAHPENMRSTSALDFVFAPPWPSIGGFAGFAEGRLIRSIHGEEKDAGS